MPVGVGWTNLRYGHTEVGSFREQHDGVVLRILTILNNQTCQGVDIGRYFRNQDAVSPCGNGSFKGGKARVTTKHTEKDSFAVRSGSGAYAIDKLCCSIDRCMEADTVVSARHIIVHRLGDAPDRDTFCREHGPVAQRIIATDDNEAIQFKKAQILYHLVGEIDPVIWCVTGSIRCQMGREFTHLCPCWICPCGL